MNSVPRFVLHLLFTFSLGLCAIVPCLTQKVDPSLVAYWNFDQGDAADNSGNGHNGRLFGTPAFVPGPCGSAIRFNGVDSYIRVPKSEKLTGMTQMTLCYWIKFHHTNTSTAGNSIGNGSDDLPETPGFYTYTGYSEISHFLGLQPNARGIRIPYDATVPLDEQEFSFIVFVVTNESLKAYRNGCLIETISRDGWNLARDWDWFIGWSGDTNGDGKFLEGMMDEIRIYDCPLSEEELLALYAQCGGTSLTADYADVEMCRDNGSIVLQGRAQGGTPPYSYSWSPLYEISSVTEATPTVYPYLTTTYEVVITDAAGCTVTEEVTVTVHECDWLVPFYALCPGTRKREYVSFPRPSSAPNDTIVEITFTGEGAKLFSVDTTLPITLSSSPDMRLPLIIRGVTTDFRRAIMTLRMAQSAEPYRIQLYSTVSAADPLMLNISTIHTGERDQGFDTCVTVTSVSPVKVSITDTIGSGTGSEPRLLSPSLPIVVEAGGTMDFCFHIPPGTGYDTLLLGAEPLDEEYTMCFAHMVVIDRTGTLGVGEQDAATAGEGLLRLSLYPNPANDEMQIRFSLPKKEEVDVDIIDAAGRVVRSILQSTDLSAEEHMIRCNLQGLEPGVYYTQVRSGTIGGVRAFVIVR